MIESVAIINCNHIKRMFPDLPKINHPILTSVKMFKKLPTFS